MSIFLPNHNIFEYFLHVLNTVPNYHQILLSMDHENLNIERFTSALIFEASMSLLARATNRST